jgi:hypothetical protein
MCLSVGASASGVDPLFSRLGVSRCGCAICVCVSRLQARVASTNTLAALSPAPVLGVRRPRSEAKAAPDFTRGRENGADAIATLTGATTPTDTGASSDASTAASFSSLLPPSKRRKHETPAQRGQVDNKSNEESAPVRGETAGGASGSGQDANVESDGDGEAPDQASQSEGLCRHLEQASEGAGQGQESEAQADGSEVEEPEEDDAADGGNGDSGDDDDCEMSIEASDEDEDDDEGEDDDDDDEDEDEEDDEEEEEEEESDQDELGGALFQDAQEDAEEETGSATRSARRRPMYQDVEDAFHSGSNFAHLLQAFSAAAAPHTIAGLCVHKR